MEIKVTFDEYEKMVLSKKIVDSIFDEAEITKYSDGKTLFYVSEYLLDRLFPERYKDTVERTRRDWEEKNEQEEKKMYKCMECGHLFEEGEQKTWKEERGEFWGDPCTETMSGCPLCKNAYEEIKPCAICDTYDHDAKDEVCEHCKTDVIRRYNRIIKDNFSVEEIKLIDVLIEEGRI